MHRKIRYDVKGFIEYLHTMQHGRYYPLVCIDGPKGGGKSVLSIQIGEANSEKNGKEFDLKNSVTWEDREAIEWVDGKKNRKQKYTTFIIEEIQNMMRNRHWQDENQIKLINTFDTCRDRALCIITNTPHFFSVDKQFRQAVNIWIRVIRRKPALAEIYEQSENPFSMDPWERQKNYKNWKLGGNHGINELMGYLTWKDLSPEQEKIYMELRNTKRLKASEQRIKRDEVITRDKEKLYRLIHYMVYKLNMKYKTVADECGYTPERVAQIAKTELPKYTKI